MTAKEESMYQMLLQVAAGTRFFATTADVNITYTASVAAVASTTAIAVRGLMADIVFPPLESDRHPDMAARKAKPLVEALCVDTRVMRKQLDELAASRLRLADRPLHQLLADAAAAAISGDA